MNVDMNTAVNSAATGAYRLQSAYAKKDTAKAETDTAAAADAASAFGEAAVFEKSGDTDNTASVSIKPGNSAQNASKTGTETNQVDEKRSALIAQLKADQETRQNQLMDIVRKTMEGQGKAIGSTDDMWKFLAGGNFTVDAATKAQAQEDISEDGYWGANKTSERILDFAKALAGDDPAQADKMLDAFKKGFEEATKTWGKELPDLTKETYDAVIKGFEDWKNQGSTQSTGANASNSASTEQAAQAEGAAQTTQVTA